MNIEERIELAYSKLGLREPFIAAVVGRLPKIVVDGDPNLTAVTNGDWLKFGREWVTKYVPDDEELFGLCMHEALHVVWMHMWRREGRHPSIWNIANDAIINRTILNKGYRIPKGGVLIDWATETMDSEEAYNRLMKEPEEDDGDGDGDGGEGDDGSEGDGGSGPPSEKQTGTTKKFGKGGWNKQGDLVDAEEDSKQANMEATIRACAEMARACGDSSSIVDRVLGSIPKATVNWKDEVRAALTSSSRDDFTYRRFSRRFMARGLYLPSLYSEAMGGLIIGFDTSGSVTPNDARQICGEIQGIVNDLSPEWVEVVYCDSQVQRTQRFERGDELRLNPPQGGGTRFKPVFDYADERQQAGDRIAAMIYLTDMEGNLEELIEPDYPVVFGNVYGSSNATAPFGSVVRVVVS